MMIGLKGYSIITIIIISITIAVSIFVALWFKSFVENYSRFEEIRISSRVIYSNNSYWIIELLLINTGHRLAIIDNIFINGKPLENYGDLVKELAINGTSFNYNTGYPLDIGKKVIICFKLSKKYFAHGSTIQIRIKTRHGNEYFTDIKLP